MRLLVCLSVCLSVSVIPPEGQVYDDMAIALGQSLRFVYDPLHDVKLASDKEGTPLPPRDVPSHIAHLQCTHLPGVNVCVCAAYESCDKSKMTYIGDHDAGLPGFVWTPEEVGTYYIVCGEDDHCERKQKFIVTGILCGTRSAPSGSPMSVLLSLPPSVTEGPLVTSAAPEADGVIGEGGEESVDMEATDGEEETTSGARGNAMHIAVWGSVAALLVWAM